MRSVRVCVRTELFLGWGADDHSSGLVTSPGHSSEAFPLERSRQWRRQQTLAESVLCRTWALEPASRPCTGRSILAQVRPLTGMPDVGNPPVRLGGRGSRKHSALPAPVGRGDEPEGLSSHRGSPHRETGARLRNIVSLFVKIANPVESDRRTRRSLTTGGGDRRCWAADWNGNLRMIAQW